MQTIAHHGGFLTMNSERMLYVGRLRTTSTRMLGSITIYAAVNMPFLLRRNGKKEWQELDCAILLPGESHEIAALDPIVSVLIEPEGIDLASFRCRCLDSGDIHPNLDMLRDCLRALGERLWSERRDSDLIGDKLEAALFGAALQKKQGDSRIRRVLDKIKGHPEDTFSAEHCAKIAELSFSRFLHLFKEDVGLTFRCFKAWKRARWLLTLIVARQTPSTGKPSLTDIALELGYPDSSHFSHSIRQVYGQRPKDIFAGFKRLELHTHCEFEESVPNFV